MKKEKVDTLGMTLHEKAVRLCEGGVVFHCGYFFQAHTAPDEEVPCDVCELDSICRLEIVDLCGECEAYDGKRHYLTING